MRATSKLLALALTAALQPAMAGVVSLNFEDLNDPNAPDTSVQLGSQYQAGYGITFTGDAWGLESKSTANHCNGDNVFLRAGSCGALELAQDATATPGNGTQSFILNLAGGFINEFSFVYSALAGSSVQIDIFDGADGKGNALQSISGLTNTPCNVNGFHFCNWASKSIQFSGVAMSIQVSGLDQTLMLDDLTFTPPAGGTTVPEPASAALALGALGAAAWARRRATR